MKHSLLTLAIAGLVTLPVLAVAQDQVKATSTKSKDHSWNMVYPELAAALKIKGDPVKGKIAYEECRGCHKPDGSGRPDAGYPQLAGQLTTVLIKQMLDVRTNHRDSPKMHPFIEKTEIADKDIPDIAAYLHSLPVPDTNRKGSGNNLGRGKFLYEQNCASCHGEHGEGDAKNFYPMVAGQHYPYLYRECLNIRDLRRHNANPEMVKLLVEVMNKYSDDDIEEVSDYMSRLPPPKSTSMK